MPTRAHSFSCFAIVFCLLLHSTSGFSTLNLFRPLASCRRVAVCMAGEGFGASKKQPDSDNLEAEVDAGRAVEAKPRDDGGVRRRRAEPVNVDGQAFFDKEWITQSVSTLASEEWRQGARERGEYDCPECGGTGRIQGGLATLPGLAWWPIKAFRPCPTCERAGRSYNRRGQVLSVPAPSPTSSAPSSPSLSFPFPPPSSLATRDHTPRSHAGAG
eukprot:764851-Hanusia_phi.AAC.7